MPDEKRQIADKVRGVAAEHHLTQSDVAGVIGVDRKSAHARMTGRVSFTAAELLKLSRRLDVDIARFFPEPAPSSAARLEAVAS